jgi:hypothetical protein
MFKEFYFDEQSQDNKAGDESAFVIYCDMDGVICFWEGAFEKLGYGKSKEYEAKHGQNALWDIINDVGEEFWSEMEWTKDGKQLWSFIEPYNPIILTKPTRSTKGRPLCIEGKKKWLARELPGVKAIMEDDKSKYATYNSLLIDDYESNINPWRQKGGTGILHTNTDDTISQLRELGIGSEKDII